MATNITEIADDDHLIVEGMLVGKIWDELAIPSCEKANGFKCGLVCPHPCSLAEKFIRRFLPRYFVNYARWN